MIHGPLSEIDSISPDQNVLHRLKVLSTELQRKIREIDDLVLAVNSFLNTCEFRIPAYSQPFRLPNGNLGKLCWRQKGTWQICLVTGDRIIPFRGIDNETKLDCFSRVVEVVENVHFLTYKIDRKMKYAVEAVAELRRIFREYE